MKIGFIGVGNMGGAILHSVLTAIDSDTIYISDANAEKVKELCKANNINASQNSEIAEFCDMIFLGVKPQAMSELLSSISPILSKRSNRFILISMAAGMKISTLCDMLNMNVPFIRIMPNLPVSVNEGTVLYDSESVSEQEIGSFLRLMKNSGKLIHLKEQLIDAGCAISGCGPAFVCMMIEAMADAGVKCGLPRTTAQTLAIQTLKGTAQYLESTDTHPAILKDAVCSPAGSTIAGVDALENSSFRAAVINAVDAAYKRNIELGKK